MEELTLSRSFGAEGSQQSMRTVEKTHQIAQGYELARLVFQENWFLRESCAKKA